MKGQENCQKCPGEGQHSDPLVATLGEAGASLPPRTEVLFSVRGVVPSLSLCLGMRPPALHRADGHSRNLCPPFCNLGTQAGVRQWGQG